MRIPLVRLLAVVVAASPCLVAAQEPSKSPPPAAGAAPTQETTVRGTVPDLTGRWLALGWIDLPDGRQVTAPGVWEITEQDGKQTLTHRFVTLPPAQQGAVEKGNAEGKAWKPTPDDLKQLRAAWDSLPAQDPHVAKVTNVLSGQDGFDDGLKNEARAKDALWVIQQRWDFDGTQPSLVRQVMAYSALKPSDGGGYSGNFDSATVAAAPFPMPISFKGTFGLYRVDEPKPRGFFARLFDVFSGCGRRTSAS